MVDGKEYELAGAGQLGLACLSLGRRYSYFCWHPADLVGSVGACRVLCEAIPHQRGRHVYLDLYSEDDRLDGTFISIGLG